MATVFLDRDGTINRKAAEGEYITRWEDFEFLDGAIDAIRALTDAGDTVVVVTNQRGVALGRMSEADLEEIHRRMLAELSAHGARVAAVYSCTHEKGTCRCRKPAPGLLEAAQHDIPGIDFATATMIGDSISDMKAANAVGIAGILVGAGSDIGEWQQAATLAEAVGKVLAERVGASSG